MIWFFLVAFVALAAILLVIHRANLKPLHFKCAPEKKSSFEGQFSSKTSPYPSVSRRIGSPLLLYVNAQNKGVVLSSGGKE